MSERHYLFRGCLIPTRLPFLEASSRFVLDRLELDYEDLPGATCCIEPIGLRSLARDTWLCSAARLLAIAEQDGRDMITLCNGCYMSLQEARHALMDGGKRNEVNAVLSSIGREYRGTARVRHLAGLLMDEREKVRSLVTSPVPLRVAAHPGCHMIRPSAILGVDRHFRPQALTSLASLCGATVTCTEDWPACCGGGLSGADEGLSLKILADATRQFRASGASAILTPCPFCFVHFDLRQRDGLPVLHLSELVALAMGARPEGIGLQHHRIKLNLP